MDANTTYAGRANPDGSRESSVARDVDGRATHRKQESSPCGFSRVRLACLRDKLMYSTQQNLSQDITRISSTPRRSSRTSMSDGLSQAFIFLMSLPHGALRIGDITRGTSRKSVWFLLAARSFSGGFFSYGQRGLLVHHQSTDYQGDAFQAMSLGFHSSYVLTTGGPTACTLALGISFGWEVGSYYTY